MVTDPAQQGDPPAGRRFYRWLSDSGNHILILYLIAAILALVSIGSHMFGVGSGGPVTDLQLVMVLIAAGILLYLAILSAGYEG